MRLEGGIDDSDAVWDRVWAEALQVNVLAPFWAERWVHALSRAPGGILVTLSSWAAQRGPENPALIAYAASKGAVLSATKAIARNYAKNNILAFGVAPGVVRTRLSEASLGGDGLSRGDCADACHGRMGSAFGSRKPDRVPVEWRLPASLGRCPRRQWRDLYPLSAVSDRPRPRSDRSRNIRQDRIGVSILSASAA